MSRKELGILAIGGQKAFFADGALPGWNGILGGTRMMG
jgi:hypothetical protein